MPDRLFFLLTAIVAAAMVFIAIDPFADRAPRGPVSGGGRDAQDVTVRGDELHRFQAGGTSIVTVETPEGADAPIVRFARLPDDVYEDPRFGPHLVLAEDLEFAFESRPVEVAIEARAEGDFAALQFQANYLAQPGAESGWITFDLTADYQTYTFAYTPPSRGQTQGYDYLGVRPLAPGRRGAMEVRSIRIRATGPKVRAEPQTPSPIP